VERLQDEGQASVREIIGVKIEYSQINAPLIQSDEPVSRAPKYADSNLLLQAPLKFILFVINRRWIFIVITIRPIRSV